VDEMQSTQEARNYVARSVQNYRRTPCSPRFGSKQHADVFRHLVGRATHKTSKKKLFDKNKRHVRFQSAEVLIWLARYIRDESRESLIWVSQKWNLFLDCGLSLFLPFFHHPSTFCLPHSPLSCPIIIHALDSSP
jgi:hypothetical protein